jgi:hypothetical protein
MVFAAQAVLTPMLGSCSDPACGEQGVVVTAPTESIVDVLASGSACNGVTPICQSEDDASACTKYWVLPNATGDCHIDVDLAKGTRFSADVTIHHGPGSCDGFYPEVASDSNLEVP